MDFYGTVVAMGRDKHCDWQDIRLDTNEQFPLADKGSKVWRAFGQTIAKADVGDRVVVQWTTYPRIAWGVWKAKAIARPPAANKDRKELA